MDKYISVIVPCYNGVKYLDRCIKSLLEQTIGYRHLEMIFVNDASTDNTLELLLDYEKKYQDNVIVINCTQNGRQGTARNLGIKYSTCDYIAFLDQDDWIDPTMYEKLYSKAKELDLDVAGCLSEVIQTKETINENPEKKADVYFVVNDEASRENMLYNWHSDGFWVNLYRKSVIVDNDIYFPEKLVYDDNYWGTLIRFYVKSVYVLGEVLHHYYLTMESSSSLQKNQRYHLDRLKVQELALKELKERGFYAKHREYISKSFMSPYFFNSLHMFFGRFSAVPIDVFRHMVSTLQKEIPDYMEYAVKSGLENEAKYLIDSNITQEELNMLQEVYIKKGIRACTNYIKNLRTNYSGFVEERKNTILKWNEAYLPTEKKYIEKVDELIGTGTNASYAKICEMFEDTEDLSNDEIISIGKIPIDIFREREELSYLIQAVNIYYREQAVEVEVTIFDHGDMLADIIDAINEVRLLLFEFEFFKEDEPLVTYVKNNKISHAMLSYLAASCIGELRKVKEEPCYEPSNQASRRHAGKKIAFILCTNNDVYMQHALYFISMLEVPYGCEVEVLTIQDANSMTSGYNEGMTASSAKYKIYMHQDVLIVNQYFIYDILDIFEDTKVGMIGMVGAPRLSSSKVMWYSCRIGKIYSATAYKTDIMKFESAKGKYESVEVVDGLLMATQYDIPWREDLFDKWDMYDVSQSLEFHRRGYEIVVPNMNAPWCLHDDGFMNLDSYYGELDKLKKEYYGE
ncbi:MAG: glycosyltransferase [Muribaculaceae bacterium]|nr:glycosyltransferase [Muribaculaceae bacterium]